MQRQRQAPSTMAYPHRQSGVVLFIALIALLLLTLAGVSMTRVVDNSMTLAGNLAFRQSALAATDIGINTAVTWLASKNAVDLWNDDDANGYRSAMIAEPDWTNAAAWPTTSIVTFNGPNGNVISYRIFRLCNIQGNAAITPNPGAVNAVGQSCNTGLAPIGGGGAATAGNSQSAGAIQFQGNLALFYRVVVRVVGPRNTTSYVQVLASRGAN